MQINISASIAVLLQEHNSVGIPGLGGFVAQYKPAQIDQVEGKLSPPSKQLTFNKNLLFDDGLLVKHVREQYGMSFAEAMRQVDAYVKEVKETIARNEIVAFPGVGRLYRDYEGNFQFVAEDTNLNIESYGLPVVQFYPVLRRTATPAPTSARKTTSKPVVAAAGSTRRRWSRSATLVSIVLVLGISTAIYWKFFYPHSASSAPAIAENESSELPRYNVSPSRMTADDSVPPLANKKVPDEPKDDVVPGLDSEGPTLQPNQRYATIAIGMFGSPDNVKRLVKQIYEAGYEPFTERVGDLTRVGVQMTYDSDVELQKALQDIRTKFDKRAKVLKK